MKQTLVFLALAAILLHYACTNPDTGTAALRSRVDSLERQLTKSYKPGFGEFMSGIQVHHAKLWFAGLNQNWRLADFEAQEIREALDAIQQYEPDRPETREIPTVYPALGRVEETIQAQDLPAFQAGFAQLTTACNACHQKVNYGFNQIKIPDQPPFSNQIFPPQSAR